MEAGYLGVGAMGQPMAHKLLDAGHSPTIYDINETASASASAAVGAACVLAPRPRRPVRDRVWASPTLAA